MRLTRPALLLLLSILLLAACNPAVLPPTPLPSPTVELLPTETETAPSATPEADQPTEASPSSDPLPLPALEGPTTVYRDETLNYEFAYPEGWNLTDLPADIKATTDNFAVTVTSWGPEDLGPRSAPPEDGTKLDIAVYARTQHSLEQAAALWRQNVTGPDSPQQITAETTVLLQDGSYALRWVVESGAGDRMISIVTVVNGNTIIFNGYGDETLVEAIAGTLQPASQ